MDAVERAAFVSVGRACGFGALAILCFMTGLSYEPALAARAGGVLSLVMTGILLLKATMAARRPYKRTETWIILNTDDRPQPHRAQAAISTALRGAFLWFAQWSAGVTVILLTAAVILPLLSPA